MEQISTDTSAMRKVLLLSIVLFLVACGASDENLLPDDGPIANPAVDAGATQAQGASSGSGGLPDDGLRIEIDDEIVEVTSEEQLQDLVASAPVAVGEVPHCAEIVNVVPADTIERCSYTPDSIPLITDTLVADQCPNGQTFYILNRPSGEGAFVGVDGLYWFELTAEEYSLGSVAAICDDATG